MGVSPPRPLRGTGGGARFFPEGSKKFQPSKGVVSIAKKAGRPRLSWSDKDIRDFKELVSCNLSKREISSFFGVDEKTLNKLIDTHLHDELNPNDPAPVTFRDAQEIYGSAMVGLCKREMIRLALSGDFKALKYCLNVWGGLTETNGLAVSTEQAQPKEAPLDDITRRLAEVRTNPGGGLGPDAEADDTIG